jgi:hypothetical protein
MQAARSNTTTEQMARGAQAALHPIVTRNGTGSICAHVAMCSPAVLPTPEVNQFAGRAQAPMDKGDKQSPMDSAPCREAKAAKDALSRAAAPWITEHVPRGALCALCLGKRMPDLRPVCHCQPYWLQSLALSFNQLTSFPAVAMPCLRSLQLSHNQLTSIPEDLDLLMPNLQV